MKKTIQILFCLLVLVISGCVPPKKEPPKVNSIESLLIEFEPEINGWSSVAYLVSCSIGFEENHSMDFLFFRSYNLPYGVLMLAINDDGTVSSKPFRIEPDNFSTVPITEFLKIDSSDAVKKFYDDETVQKQLRQKSPYQLKYEYIKPDCKKPVWSLVLHDGLNNSTLFYLDPDSLTVWKSGDYRKSEAYQAICDE
ncbi:MAG: hypothetical protein CL609_02145 [Anaerolineaceae bacterium]|nr:hypothetical protein [Anaerolineaceae bacterium]